MVVGEIARPVDVLVIGGGPGGYTAAARAAELGHEVVLVERARLGGACLNVGCIPSKAIISVAEHVHHLGNLREAGVTGDATVDMKALQRWKSGVVDDLVTGVGQLLAKVEVVEGTGRLLDDRRVSVESGDRGSHFQFDACILAAGSEPIALPDLPVDGEQVIGSTEALDLEEVPEQLVVVGGGYIGLELGTAYAKLGADVTIVEALERIGGGFDADLVRTVESSLDRLGVRVLTRTRAVGFEDGRLVVATSEGEQRILAERVLVTVGRRPSTSELQLDRAGIVPDARGHVPVDEQCRTSARRIYAIGDLVAGPALAHKAAQEGRVAAEAIAGLPSAADQSVPLIAFTDPEMAAVGLSEEAAKGEGFEVVVGRTSFATSGRARTLGVTEGLVKLVFDAEDEVLLGVHIAGPAASDLISEGALAVEMATRVDDIVGTIHPHPTLGESFAEAASAARRRIDRRRRR